MPPPKFGPKKRRSKREINDFTSQSESFTQSMPTTPNQQRALYNQMSNGISEDPVEFDSDTAYGFDNNWYGHRSTDENLQDFDDSSHPTYI